MRAHSIHCNAYRPGGQPCAFEVQCTCGFLDARRRETRERLQTQDGRCTSYPIFIVQEHVRLYGIDLDYCSEWVWLDQEGNEADAGLAAVLDSETSCGRVSQDWTQAGFCDRWEYVQTFFTEAAADDFIDRNTHRHTGRLRTYVESAYRNPELQFVRSLLLQEVAAGD